MLQWFRLAALWGCPVAEAQGRCSSEEFTHWLAYWTIDPWGGIRADHHAALLACLLYNANRGKGAGSKKPEDFLMKWGPTEEQSGEEMAQALQMWAAVLNDPMRKQGGLKPG